MSLVESGNSSTGRLEPDDPVPAVISADRFPIVTVPLEALVLENSPRSSGRDEQHARVLAEADRDLPPILVHRPTMRVIDGSHRVEAARLNGRTDIEARLLDCDDETAFVLAVRANVTHGLPLSRADRKAAAARIVAAHPHWSDRVVAEAVGLSGKTVSRVRAASGEGTERPGVRVGRDGKRHPLSTDVKRRQAAAMLAENPGAGLREIARAIGLSPSTVRDVRNRVDRNESPVPQRPQRPGGDAAPRSEHRSRRPASERRSPPESPDPPDPKTLLTKLKNDPSLRFNEVGRRTLRWLHQHTMHVEGWESADFTVPDHCAPMVADLARSCALAWQALAEQLEQRAQNPGQG